MSSGSTLIHKSRKIMDNIIPVKQNDINIYMCKETIAIILQTGTSHSKIATLWNPDILFSPLEGSHIFPLIPFSNFLNIKIWGKKNPRIYGLNKVYVLLLNTSIDSHEEFFTPSVHLSFKNKINIILLTATISLDNICHKIIAGCRTKKSGIISHGYIEKNEENWVVL